MKKKKDVFKKKVFMIECVPYNQQCFVILNGTYKDLEKEMLKHKNPMTKENLIHIEKNRKEYDEMKIANGVLFHTLPVGFCMIINMSGKWIEDFGTICHESLHLVNYCLRRAGLPLTEDSEEAYTYLLGDVVKKILRGTY